MSNRAWVFTIVIALVATVILSIVLIFFQRKKINEPVPGEPAATDLQNYQKLTRTKPNNVFGTIPPAPVSASKSLIFPAGSILTNNIPSSELSSLPPTVPVQKLDKTKQLTRLQAQAIADNLGLIGLPTKLSDNSPFGIA